MATKASEYPPWTPNTAYYNKNIFQQLGKAYVVLEDFVSGIRFNPNDGRVTLLPAFNKAAPIVSLAITQGRLIATFSDGEVLDIGPISAEGVFATFIEHLTIDGNGVLSSTTEFVNVDLPVKLWINGICYFSEDYDPNSNFTVEDTGPVWKPDAEFALNQTFSALVEYAKL